MLSLIVCGYYAVDFLVFGCGDPLAAPPAPTQATTHSFLIVLGGGVARTTEVEFDKGYFFNSFCWQMSPPPPFFWLSLTYRDWSFDVIIIQTPVLSASPGGTFDWGGAAPNPPTHPPPPPQSDVSILFIIVYAFFFTQHTIHSKHKSLITFLLVRLFSREYCSRCGSLSLPVPLVCSLFSIHVYSLNLPSLQ